MLPALIFPNFDPVALELGPLVIRWYALAYIAGILFGWWYVRHLASLPPPAMTPEQVDDLVVWVTFGVLLGGRLGYVLFYKPLYYLGHPLEALQVWHGGMSFHGGALGVILAMVLFAWRKRLSFLRVGDVVATAVPCGLFLGRIANFINGELWGRVTDVPWGMIFPGGGPEPRHPSQLYEATLEGLVLGLVLFFLAHRKSVRTRPGMLGGSFLIGYAIARSIGELFREPDAFLGFIWEGLTMGQILSVPLLVAGIWLVLRARRT